MAMRAIRSVFLAFTWMAVSAWAALPDPVALGAAVETGDIGAARSWLDQGMDPNMEADRVGTGLMIAAWEGNIAMMELFASRGADVNRVNRYGEQALQLAAWRGNLEAVRWLLDHGASTRRKGKDWSAMHYAAYAGREDIARLLLDHGADVNARAPNDSTVLMMAALAGKEDVAKVLIDAGADTSLANDRGDTAMTWAMRYGNLRIAKMVSSSETFAKVARLPPESFGTPTRSVPAPSEITDLLQQIQQAKARKQPTDELRQRLAQAIERFKKEVPADKGKAKAAKRRPELVITARRKGGGERAEILSDAPVVLSPEAAARARQGSSYDEARLAEFNRLLEQLNRAQEEGRPTADLRRAVREAYEQLKLTSKPGPGRP
jgi:uncharacterized protein